MYHHSRVHAYLLFLLVQPTESQDEDSQDEPPASVSTSGVTADIYSGVSIRVRKKALIVVINTVAPNTFMEETLCKFSGLGLVHKSFLHEL